MQRVVVSGFLYREGKCLLIQRGLNEKFLPGYWENPGGKLDFGEDPLQGVLREVKEETGLDAEVEGIHHIWHWMSMHDGKQTHFVQLAFILRPTTQKIVLEHKMNDYKWVGPEEYHELTMSNEMKGEISSGFDWVKKHWKP